MAEQQTTRRPPSRRGKPSIGKRVGGFFQSLWLGIWYYASSPFRWYRNVTEQRRRRAASAGKGGFFRKLRYWVFLPFFLVGSLFSKMFRGIGWWYRSTSAKYLVQALPAIIVGIGALAVTAVAYLRPQDKLIARYEKSGISSMQAKNFKVARVCYERLLELQGDRPELVYRLALAEEGLDEKVDADKRTNRAYQLMSDLAPDDKPGYIDAHLWKGDYLLESERISPETIRLAAVHFKRVLQKKRNDTPEFFKAANGMYNVYMRTNQIGAAMQFVGAAAAINPELRIIAVKAGANAGKAPELVRREAELTRDYYKRKLEEPTGKDTKEEEEENKKIRIALAETYRILDDFNAAEQTLIDGLQMSNGDKDYHNALANLYAAHLVKLTEQRKIGYDNQMKLMQAVLDHDPGNLFMLQRLYAMSAGEGEGAEKARDLMRRVMASGNATAMPTLHLIMGNYEFSRGRFDKAKIHLEQAYKLNPNMLEIANNYAWVLATTTPSEQERALKIIDMVIEKAPLAAQYRDTRGQILLQMGRYQDALADLEFALKEMSESRSLHRALQKCYDNLDMKEMAAVHKDFADKLTERNALQQMRDANRALFNQPPRNTSNQPTSVADDPDNDRLPRGIQVGDAVKSTEGTPNGEAKPDGVNLQNEPAEQTSKSEGDAKPAEPNAGEAPKAEEPKAEEKPAETPKAEEKKAEEPKAPSEPPAAEPKAPSESPAAEPKAPSESPAAEPKSEATPEKAPEAPATPQGSAEPKSEG
ncbi:MAG: tetratricopeptide repeat protein [Planctomycetota bacterium]